ncbi:alpha/beta hydrolase [Ketobacter sp.]|uniref:alpha/beta hydrolase n=1 Tax=Ketobacter sp. TaxID=2083498 RepID=UPI000F1DBF77|nr:alpha/beta hydrolase [Ketobacter sp.]RLT95977.1 MAG: alpha/beta hydrolase [Ketobacter sp.]
MNYFFLLLLTGLLLSGCSGNKPLPNQIFLMPTPGLFDEEMTNQFLAGKSVSGDPPTILYATDREPAAHDDKRFEFYSDQRGQVLRLGQAQIRLTHEEAVSYEELRHIALLKDRDEDYPLEIAEVDEFGALQRTISPLDEQTPVSPEPGLRFSNLINAQLTRSKSKDVYIYVHGYKVNFENPVLVAGELWHFMGTQGAFIAYSWPSSFKVTDYFSDIEDAEQSARYLRSLILHISQTTDAEKIHLLGYSMGTRLVARTVADLSLLAYGLDAGAVADQVKLGNVILVGSDLDRSILAGYLLDGMLRVCDSFSLYQSAQDKTLHLSEFLYGKARAGKAMDAAARGDKIRQYLLDNPQIRIIDISQAAEIERNNGHSYFRSSPWVSSDILATLRFNLSPEQRGLERGEDGVTWQFPEDYLSRLRVSVQRKITAHQP